MRLSARWAVRTAVLGEQLWVGRSHPVISDSWRPGGPADPLQPWVCTWYFLCLLWDLSQHLEVLRSDLHTKLLFLLLTVLTVALNISLPRHWAFTSKIHDTYGKHMPVWEWRVTHSGLDHSAWTTTHQRSHVSEDVVSCPEPASPHAARGEHL